MGLKVPEKKKNNRRIWIQAVSLGEILALEPLLKKLSNDSRNEIFLTTTTSTGYAAAKEKFSHELIELAYFPLDFWPFCRNVWNTVRPDMAICMETEMWPEHFHQAGKRRTPVFLVNARLSDRSYKYVSKFAPFARKEIGHLTEILAGSKRDKSRFESIGLDKNRISVTGNLKVDRDIEPVLEADDRRALKNVWGLGDGFVLLGSGTWPAEETMLVKAFRQLRASNPCARLLMVPRHAERRDEIAKLLVSHASDFVTHFKTSGEPSGRVDILVADTHGELKVLTQLADLAFIGKSLPPENEGQTPVEACALGVPTLFGPGMRNFPGILEQILDYGAAMQVVDEQAAITEIIHLSNDSKLRSSMSAAGLKWHQESRGAVQKTLDRLQPYLDRI